MPSDALKPIEGPELFFGIVGPLGTDLDLVTEVLEYELRRVSYRIHLVRLSSILETISSYRSLKTLTEGPEDERIDAYMDAGTELRETTGYGDTLALLSVINIRNFREQVTGDPNEPVSQCAYVLRSLKHPDEIASLRHIYGRAFHVISAYAPREDRIQSLSTTISESHSGFDETNCRSVAERLISKDEEEEGHKLGQDVTEAFPLGDLFVDVRSRQQLQRSIQRYIQLLFGYPFHSPSRDEFGMFHAHSVALRSVDLARQVGAVVTTPEGDVLATGCNDVPKSGGGQHWWPDANDNRDFQKGYDTSTRVRNRILDEILDRFSKHGWLVPEKAGTASKALVEELLEGKSFEVLKGAQVLNLLEFGRMIHAEMAAITDAGRRGISIEGTTLYCTTFPCHMCARHIISSGIKRVVYIEPYPKSMAAKLYPESIVVDSGYWVEGNVNFEPFVGVAPRKYMELFSAPGKRKLKDGTAIKWEERKSSPTLFRIVHSYLFIEQKVVGEIVPDRMRNSKLKFFEE